MSKLKKTWTLDEAKKMSVDYFRGDEIAADAYIAKYALKQGSNEILEPTPDYMHHRIASEIHRIEKKYKNPLSEEQIFEVLDRFKYIVPGGSPMAGIGNPLPVSLSNCFVIGNKEDSYGAICKTDEEQVQLSKRRGGVGHDLSYIRPKDSIVHNAAKTSSGMVSFMERYSHSIRETCQAGRRGALMLSCHVKHPQALDFISAKLDNTKITGANISIKLDDEFMESVIARKAYMQKFPIDSETPSITKELDAYSFWQKLMYNAWKTAEPGILFWDHITSESVARLYGKEYEEMSTNPCFTGDTIIAVADGRNGVPIEQLAKENKSFLVYSGRKSKSNPKKWQPEIKNAIAFKTGTKKVLEITLSDGSAFKCTHNHKLALDDDTTYVEAINSLNKKLAKFFTFSIKLEKNVYLDECVTVVNIKEIGEENVYDLNVEDNHNFYIITKTDNNSYLNCSGILVHNCGEVPLNPYSSCILLSINLYSYVVDPFTEDAHFDFDLFRTHAAIAQRILDDIIELECEKIHQIIDKIKNDPESDSTKQTEIELWHKILKNHENTRRTGLGITALGDMIAALNMTYGTEEATAMAVLVQRVLANSAYESSINLAAERGSFKIWSWEKERWSPFINRIIHDMSDDSFSTYMKYGRRNIQCLSIAPTGTLSLMTQTTSGIECVFMPYYTRRRKVEPDQKYDFKDATGDCFQEYNIIHHKLIEWYAIQNNYSYETSNYKLSLMSVKQLADLVATSPYNKATTSDVNWLEKVKMQGEMQQYVDHSISVTVNLPKETTTELISEVYMTAWKTGCKGCTIYRDGSRDGVLIAKDDNEDKKPNILQSGSRSKRKPVLPAIVDVVTARGQKYAVLIGIDNNMPYEVFAFKIEQSEVPIFKSKKQTTITKIRKKVYSLGPEYADVAGADNIISRFGSEEEQSITRMVSTMLRGGRIPLEEIIDQIIKSSTSIEKFSKALAVCLQKFLKNDITLHEKCDNCGGEMISYEGCKKCKNCGQSKCG